MDARAGARGRAPARRARTGGQTSASGAGAAALIPLCSRSDANLDRQIAREPAALKPRTWSYTSAFDVFALWDGYAASLDR